MTRSRTVVPILTGIVAAFAFAGTVSAHTGRISVTQTCTHGNLIHASLDANVAASAQWTVRVNGTVVNIGDGPGPADLGNFDGGFSAGTASLTITFRQESNVYTVKLKDVQPCPSPSPTPTATPTTPPSPSPSPTATPTPTTIPVPSPSSPSTTPSATTTHTPNPTLPPTSTLETDSTPPIPPSPAPLLALLAGIAGGVTFLRWRTVRG